MSLQVLIKGTLPELSELYHWEILCELVRVDFYKRSLVSDNEVFTITEADLQRVGLIQTSGEENHG